MIVVCDTNVCIYDTHFLRKKGGPALIKILQSAGGKLLVPDVLNQEYVDHFVAASLGARAKAENGLSALQTLLGRRLNRGLPSREEIRARGVARLKSLEPVIRTQELTADVKIAAADRTLANKPPSSKSDHGFKDCLIWESILRLPPGTEVHLVSRDIDAFFEEENLSGLLAAEAVAVGINVKGYNVKEDRSLVKLVQALASVHPLSEYSIAELIELNDSLEESFEAAPLTVSVGPQAPVLPEIKPEQRDDIAADTEGLRDYLDSELKVFNGLDTRILGFVAYLDGPSREQLFSLVTKAGITAGIASNVIDRLVMVGAIRDTGNHFIPSDRRIGELAARLVEDEVAALITANY